MSSVEFTIHLGGGLYMDNNGLLIRTPPEDRPTFELPGGGLPFKPEKLEKTFQGISKALPDPQKDPAFRTKLGRLGVPDDVIKFLGKVGEIAGVLSKVVGVVGFAVDIAGMLGLFKSGPDALEALINQRFDHLEDLLRALEMQNRLDFISTRRNRITLVLNNVYEYLEELKLYPPSPARLEARLQDMRQIRGEAFHAVLDLTTATTWLATFNANNYKTIWPWLQGVLHNQPPASSAVLAQMPAQNTNRFDHRLMILTVPYTVTGYLNLIKAISPEYRSTGEFDRDLRLLTANLEALAVAMRQTSLARTIYQRWHFDFALSREQVILQGFAGLVGEPKINPDMVNWSVGAVDLCQYTDSFFEDPQVKTAALVAFKPNKLAALDFRWTPPAKLKREQQPMSSDILYRITNPQECADAANAQSEQDYSDLLAASGYLNLAQLAALVRHLSSEPDRSETVSGEISLRRQPQPAISSRVQSDPIPFTGVIESAARLEPHNFNARAYLTTQPLGRQRPIHYRVLLRTLPMRLSGQVSYDEYYSTRYVNDLRNPGFKKLQVHTYPTWVVGEVELISGSSPEQLRQASGCASLNAYTFDWFVPVPDPFVLGFEQVRDQFIAQWHAAGWSEAAQQGLTQDNQPKQPKQPLIPLSGKFGGSLVRDVLERDLSISDVLWEDGAQDWQGEQRNVRIEKVDLEYTLRWRADRLSVQLSHSHKDCKPENPRNDRNYLVYLVVEETLPSGQKLHSAYPIPVTGALTYVPEKFFREEARAKARAHDILTEFGRRYALSAEVGPLDPIIGRIHPGDLISVAGLQRLMEVAEQHQPELLRQVVLERREAHLAVKE